MEQGHCRVLVVYFGGVLFGALGSALTNPLQGVVGASAGVYSLLISHISHGILVCLKRRISLKTHMHLKEYNFAELVDVVASNGPIHCSRGDVLQRYHFHFIVWLLWEQ